MASNSEVGHAKNIANLNLLNTHIVEIGEIYKPSNSDLLLTKMQSIYTKTFADQKLVNQLTGPNSDAIKDRDALFKPLNKDLTKLRKAYKTTKGVTPEKLEGLMIIIRKLKGVRKEPLEKPKNNEEEKKNHSVAQLSFDQRTNNMDLLIAYLQNTENYNPNEVEYKIATYSNKKDKMLATTGAVNKTFVPLNTARTNRALSMDNLVDTANLSKNYIATILDEKSPQYKAIAKIKFKK